MPCSIKSCDASRPSIVKGIVVLVLSSSVSPVVISTISAYLDVILQKVFSVRTGTNGVMKIQGRVEDTSRFWISACWSGSAGTYPRLPLMGPTHPRRLLQIHDGFEHLRKPGQLATLEDLLLSGDSTNQGYSSICRYSTAHDLHGCPEISRPPVDHHNGSRAGMGSNRLRLMLPPTKATARTWPSCQT